MSSVYHTEPKTSGKVVLHTTMGDIDVELWPKEAPLACRNFVQLALEGYYDGTLFHRVIGEFMVQGGDPTGTGTGGESIWGKAFRDEFHARLRFNHRGQLAMANENKPDTNRSQFFLTLDECRWLDGKHTIFGTVSGNTVFNLLRIGTVDVNDDHKPLYDVTLKTIEVLVNPFDDVVPRVRPQVVGAPKEKKSIVATKNRTLLSFVEGDDAEDEIHERTKRIVPLPPPDEPDVVDEKKPPLDLDEDARDFTRKMRAKVRDRMARLPPQDDDKLREARRDLRAAKAIVPRDDDDDDDDEDQKAAANAQLAGPYEVMRYKNKRHKATVKDREQDTLARLAKFKSSLASTKLQSSDTHHREEKSQSYHGQILQDDDDNDDDGNAPNWFLGKLKFKKHTDDLFRTTTTDDKDHYVTIDSRSGRGRL